MILRGYQGYGLSIPVDVQDIKGGRDQRRPANTATWIRILYPIFIERPKTKLLPWVQSTILPKRRNLPRAVPPLRIRKGSAAHEPSGSDRPLPSIRKVKKTRHQQNGGNEEENVSYNSAAQPDELQSSEADTQDDAEEAPSISISLSKVFAGLKP